MENHNEIMTVSQVSKQFHISTRMLRYYEKIGLITSQRKEDYAYRIYDEVATRRIQQIIILRKLRIPLKQIAVILDDDGQVNALHIMQETVSQLSEEINALSKIREILNVFVSRLDENIRKQIHLDLLEDRELLKVIDALSLSTLNLKEEYSMSELNKASDILTQKMNIRVLYLPPATVAASQYIGENPEAISGDQLKDFILSVNLPTLKPDFRVYGFNNPSPQEGVELYGYEFWATIPDSLEVSAPLEKKEFAGGLYAAHCIKIGDFHEWGPFFEEVQNSDEYEVDWREPLGMGGSLEEHLNAFTVYNDKDKDFAQIDLLIPIKLKK